MTHAGPPHDRSPGPAPLFLQPSEPHPPAGCHLVVADADCADPAREEECQRWLREAQIPLDLARPGWRKAWRLRAVAPLLRLGGPAGDRGPHVTLYEVHGADVAGDLAARARQRPGALAGGPPGARERGAIAYRPLAGVMTPANTRPAPYAHRANPTPARLEPPGPLRRHIVIVESDCTDPAHLPAFNRWYDEVHIPDVLASPGYRSAWRFEIVTPQGGRGRFLTTYEVHAADLLQAMKVRDERREAERKLGAYAGALGLAPLTMAFYEAP